MSLPRNGRPGPKVGASEVIPPPGSVGPAMAMAPQPLPAAWQAFQAQLADGSNAAMVKIATPVTPGGSFYFFALDNARRLGQALLDIADAGAILLATPDA